MPRKYRPTTLPPPFLKRIWFDGEASLDREAYPFCLPLFRHGDFELEFDSPVTIIVGENGSGKSTLLEGIAALTGFEEGGGGRGIGAVGHDEHTEVGGGRLAEALKASWLPKVGRGWFFRAETFFSLARYLEEAGSENADFLSYSHGEGFMRFFEERCQRPGVFIFDEPEAALSILRQFEFLKLLRRMQDGGQSQVIVATHAPILMALPGARLLYVNKYGLEPIRLEDTEHYRVMREFILDPHGTVETMMW